jgi:NitT/TauT family transport system ATP-binding protein
MEILKMTEVNLTYQTPEGETEALKSIDLSISDGEFTAVIGPSGCGKTTVLSLISGLLVPSGGTVTLAGQPVRAGGGDVGYMLQRDQLFEWRSIEANVRLGLEVQRIRNRRRAGGGDGRGMLLRARDAKEIFRLNRDYAYSLLEKYGLKDFSRYLPRQLSGGMRQRAALIRTLAFRPKILLLDEPFSALDYQTRIAVCDDVHAIIKAEKKTAILVTHDISEAIALADRVAVLSPRPAEIKNIYKIEIPGKPSERRESRLFPEYFDKIWKDVSV